MRQARGMQLPSARVGRGANVHTACSRPRARRPAPAAAVLSSQIDAWFDRVRRERGENTGPQPCARAVIAPCVLVGGSGVGACAWPGPVTVGPVDGAPPNPPLLPSHAGYSYCGHVMAHAYGAVDPSRVARVFVLGPSHHWYTRRCALSPAAAYGTPLGDVPIDQDVYASLRASGLFEAMTADVDEAEHSLELHMAYIVRTMRQATGVMGSGVWVGGQVGVAARTGWIAEGVEGVQRVVVLFLVPVTPLFHAPLLLPTQEPGIQTSAHPGGRLIGRGRGRVRGRPGAVPG